MGIVFYTIEENPDALALDASARGASVQLLDVSAAVPRKTEAMRAHRTQVTVHGDSFALSSGPRRPIRSVEGFRRLSPYVVEPSFSNGPLSARVFACLLALLLGVGVGALGTISHQADLMLAGAVLPLGVALSLIVAGCLLVGLRLVFGSRAPSLLASIGFLLALVVFGQAGPGGSVLIPANVAGYVWTYGVPLVAAIVLAWPRLRKAAAR